MDNVVDAPDLARTRVKFLTSEAVEPDHVREPILASWWRSRRFHVPADRISLPYLPDRNLDTPLIRAATPVLERLGDQLDGQPVSVILTDPTGVLLTQRTGDPGLHRHLERVDLVPGFSYGEEFVGTNGIGTALQDGRPTYVFGHEHYAENLESLACAGAPIHHPVTGRTVGALDLTCWQRDAGHLLVVLARTAAEQIRQALLTTGDVRELVLFQAYLRACRRSTGIVMAFNEDVVMINDRGRRLLDPADQSILFAHATRGPARGEPDTAVIALPTGGRALTRFRRVAGPGGDGTAGVVLSVRLVEDDGDGAGCLAPPLPMFLPGVVGSAPLWLRCGYEVDAGCGRGEWLVLEGEPGAGKHALARCAYRRRHPTGRLHTLDARDAAGDRDGRWQASLRRDLIEDPVDALILRHVDELAPAPRAALAAALRQARAAGYRPPWIAVTVTAEGERPAGEPAERELAELFRLFPHTVRVPPLRRHSEDLNELVPLLLGRLGHGGGLACSPAAMHLLMRASWPGNVAQLLQTLRQVVRHRRTGAILPADLPAEFRTVARRSLGRLEELERDAIVRAIGEAEGNKVRAALSLGISRATLYRKIHEYGIVPPSG